jgi:hypothetical protein
LCKHPKTFEKIWNYGFRKAAAATLQTRWRALSRRAQKWKPTARRKPRLPDGPLHVLVDSTGLEVYGAGQWLEEKQGARSCRDWCKFHLAVDANSGEIIAHQLTEQDTDDPSQVEPLLSQIDGEIDQFTVDGAYDGKPTYRSVLQHSGTASIVIPTRSTAVESGSAGPPGQRDKHIARIAKDGRLKWQAATGYGMCDELSVWLRLWAWLATE